MNTTKKLLKRVGIALVYGVWGVWLLTRIVAEYRASDLPAALRERAMRHQTVHARPLDSPSR